MNTCPGEVQPNCPGSNQQVQLLTKSNGCIIDRRCPVCGQSFAWHQLTGKLCLVLSILKL